MVLENFWVGGIQEYLGEEDVPEEDLKLCAFCLYFALYVSFI